MKYRASSKKHSTQSTKDDLEILSRILSIFTIINSSLINTRDWAFYVWTSLHTCRVHTAPDSQIFRQSTLSVRRGPFNPHLLGDFTFLPTREDQLPSAQISEYLRVPFEEFSEDSLFDDEGWSLSIWGMATGDVSNWQLLQGEGKRSSFGKKQRDKEKTR